MTAATVTARKVSTTAAMVPFGSARDAGAEPSFSFGPYQLFPRRRLLVKTGQPLQLGGRSLEILILLAERQGDVVSKSELMARAWPGITVDETALRVHVAGLRKALGDEIGDASYIKTVAGRGYCLVAPTRVAPAAGAGRAIEVRADHASRRLPFQLDETIGRSDAVSRITSLLETQRFVTIHGPGGVGKTTTAIAVASSQLATFAGDIYWLDLGEIGDPQLLPGALASTFGLPVQAHDPTPDMLEFLRERRALLIFDNCEHLIEPAAGLIERILRMAPQVSVLATSREMLRIDGEHVYRLSGLDCPTDDEGLTAERVLSFAAPRLFVKRVVASGHQFELTDADALVVTRICRKLDGLALAINVAAAQVQTLGFAEVAWSLESGYWLRWRGRRTAMPRHQTIGATIDWSYNLLSEDEQAALRYLSIFKEFFTLEAALEIARHGLADPSRSLDVVDKLVAKSMISSDLGDRAPRYRLLNSTRAYALDKLRQRGEFDGIASRAHEYGFDLGN
ncbi:helix-turn-helix transcriptional regulator [Bradyrhizobium lablabi]|uniref:ATP-binding protein n=1 Tax=Bradyrhizobium lablabi TaxID=722472 RepID=UPI001BAA261A|nr:winged helix-turn-helix domain-containing protein [Bradyrhizobium lablabi]MBR1119920.1 helix-turn-helix transcriptional regulator [Bradyrhizobium lablabi]